MALFHAKFTRILAISNPIFRWESCEGSVWKSVKKCSRLCKEIGTRDWISQVAGNLQAARSCTGAKHARNCTGAKHARSWSVMPARPLQDKKYTLAVQLPRDWNSWLSQVVSPNRQLVLFWNLTLHIPFSPQYKYPLYPRNVESF